MIGVRAGEAGRHDPAMRKAELRELLALGAKGLVRPLVSERVPLERFADAMRMLAERRAIGRVALVIGSEWADLRRKLIARTLGGEVNCCASAAHRRRQPRMGRGDIAASHRRNFSSSRSRSNARSSKRSSKSLSLRAPAPTPPGQRASASFTACRVSAMPSCLTSQCTVASSSIPSADFKPSISSAALSKIRR